MTNQYADSADLPPAAAARVVFVRQKAFAEHCAAQLDDRQFFASLYPGLNSVGVIMQHLAGNMRSRWTDFLTTDGEKPSRHRESEFAAPDEGFTQARAKVMSEWDAAWPILLDALDQAEKAGSGETVQIRGVTHSIPMAIARQLDHYGFHIGQIATIARGLVGTDHWDWFTVAPGGSQAFNRSLGYGGNGSK